MESRESIQWTPARFRGAVALILICISAGLIFGRIMAVDSISDRAVQEYRLARIPQTLRQKAKELKEKGFSNEQIKAQLKVTASRLRIDAQKARPTLSANDRSRWLTIRALVEPESRVYRYVPLDDDGKKKTMYQKREILRNTPPDSPDSFETAVQPSVKYLKEWVPYAVDKAMETPGWDSIDMVKHGLPDEEFDPADPYSGYLYSSKPTLLPTLMAGVYWVWLHTTGLSLSEHPFLVTRVLLVIYNLIPLLAGWFLMGRLIERFGGEEEMSAGWSKIFTVGALCFGTFLSTFAVTLNNHLPGATAIMFTLYPTAQILADDHPRKRYFFAAGLFGALAVACELPTVLITLLVCVVLLLRCPMKTSMISIPIGLVVTAAFFGTNFVAHGTIRPAYSQKRNHIALAKAENPAEVKAGRFLVTSFDSDDWYIYRFFPGSAKREMKNARMSYWSDRQGIDRGEVSRVRYLSHALVGHHGLFSLSPIWILSFVGSFIWLFDRSETRSEKRFFAVSVFLTTFFFLVFYVSRNQGDRNYGGMTCGLRWFFPLIPLWVLTMLPALNRLSRTWIGRAVALLLLFISTLSVAYPLWNPWSHPWILNLMYGR